MKFLVLAVHTILISLSVEGGEIFHSDGGETYSLNFEEAKQECTKYNAVIATYDQLYAAWEEGFQKCRAGWLDDGSSRYPMQQDINGCGNLVGIVDLGIMDKSDSYDVFCYKDIPSTSIVGGEIIHSNGVGRYTLNYEQAKEECTKYNGVIATYNQLHEAWENGLQECSAGWLRDGSVRYPMHEVIEGCGILVGIVDWGFKDKSDTYDVYCFKYNPSASPYGEIPITSIVGGGIIHSNGGKRYSLNYGQAKEECTKYNAVIATEDQLYEAWENGLRRCSAGWLRDGKAQYPMHEVLTSCGGTIGVIDWGFKSKLDHYDVYCYREIPTTSTVGAVFLVRETATARYELTFSEAELECTKYDAVLATNEQLEEAWLRGLGYCSGGWLADESVKYPMQYERSGCGNKAGIISYANPTKLYDAYCYRDVAPNREGAVTFHVESPEGRYQLTFAEAIKECQKYNAEIASLAQLYEAWEQGLGICRAGWLSSGQIRFPTQEAIEHCGNAIGIMKPVSKSNFEKYDVFCYGVPETTEVIPEIEIPEQPTEVVCVDPASLSNVAGGRPVKQSSTDTKAGGEAEKAVDGNNNSDMIVGQSCAQTEKESEPWWVVDLGESYDIYQVLITHRQDCCLRHILNAQVRVGDDETFSNNPKCGNMVTRKMMKGESIPISCGCDTPMRGRYVSIEIVDKKMALTLCEVEVLARPL